MKLSGSLLVLGSAAFLLVGVAQAVQSEIQTEIETLLAPEPEVEHGEYGYNGTVGNAVALSEDWAVVADSGALSQYGEVYIYRRTPSGCVFHQKFEGDYVSYFGTRLAMDGETLVVSGPNALNLHGRVWTYHLRNGIWVLNEELIPPDFSGSEAPVFGVSIDVQGDLLVVGASGVDIPVENGGELCLYERSHGHWGLVQRIHLEPTQEVLDGDLFRLGLSVAIDGTRVAAGPHRWSRADLRAACYGVEANVCRPAASCGSRPRRIWDGGGLAGKYVGRG